jgi:phosphatidate cytidylyltransferase
MNSFSEKKGISKERFILGSFLFSFLFLSISFSHLLWVNILLFSSLLFFALVALYEFLSMVDKEKLLFKNKFPFLALSSFLALDYALSVLGEKREISFFVLFIFALLMPVILKREDKGILESIGSNFLGFIYVLVPIFYFSCFLQKAYLIPASGAFFWMLFLVFVTKAFDVGGLFIGRTLGKRPLASTISPTKTIEGFFGGVIFSVGMALAFYNFFPQYFFFRFEAVFLAVLLALLGQWGDLVESMFKREAKIKDSNSLPGLGGALDMMDSLTFSTPFLFEYLRLLHG